jgi:hypothetical protein
MQPFLNTDVGEHRPEGSKRVSRKGDAFSIRGVRMVNGPIMLGSIILEDSFTDCNSSENNGDVPLQAEP